MPAASLVGSAWSVRPEVLVPILIVAALYGAGWWRLAHRAARPPTPARLILGLGGLACVAVALLSPLDALTDRFFVAHMVQHMLLIMVAAPLLLLANPCPVVVWALPRLARRRAGRWLTRASAFRRLWLVATAMPVAWLLSGAVLWLWHLPVAYDAALADRLLHDLEHVTFFLGAILFWWPVIHPAPRARRPAPHALRVVYLVLGAFQTAALGLLLTLAPAVLYASYAAAGRREGPGALEDQTWGGAVMWGAGGLIDMIAVLVLVHRSLGPGARDCVAVPEPGAAGRRLR
jgi:cytochrome c oxidase assembly factor CtaG